MVEAAGRLPQSWLVTTPPRLRPSARLLCLPHAGGGPSAYIPWRRLLPDHVELTIVSPPGRESRFDEPPVRDPERYLDAVEEALDALPDLPLVIFGHSMGAILAYELAVRLADRRRPPGHLFLSGRGFPDDLPPEEPLFRLSNEALVREIRARYGGLPPELDDYPELFRHAVDTIRADLELLETLSPNRGPRLDAPISVLSGREDHSCEPEGLRGWRRAGRGEVTFHVFPGGHFYLVDRAREVVELVWTSARRSLETD